jgi:hypothetical protein
VPPLVIPGLHVDQRVHSHVLQEPLACARLGIMLHYDDSSDDRWSLAWFRDPACRNGYTWLAMDDGRLIELADPAMRTPHAGPCRTKNANSAYYGLAAATNGKVPVTDAQFETVVGCCLFVFRYHGWTAGEVETRITGHDAEAIWTAKYTKDRARWGTLGRKVDPTGQRADRTPVLSLADVHREVFLRLPDAAAA